MARIAKAEHAKIRLMVEVEGKRVAEVAEAYGCTPAAIYALLARLRREAQAPAPPPRPEPRPEAVAEAGGETAPEPPHVPESAPPPDLFAPVVAPVDAPVDAPVAEAVAKPAPPSPGPRAPARPAKPARAARPGFGLCLRTAEGEETVTPFRSLEELLSAVKPILRNAARSPEPVWFCIRGLDLAELESGEF